MGDSDYEVRLKTTGRNDRCPCGSGKKYKKCHLAEDETNRSTALKALEEEAVAKAAAAQDDEDSEAPEAEPSGKGAGKRKRLKKRPKGQSASKGDGSGGKPKNIPRRGAV